MKKIFCAILVMAAISTTVFAQGKSDKSQPEKKMSNKQLVTKAVNEVFVKGNMKAFDQYWAENYIQHNPQVGNGREAVKKLFSTPNPNFKYEIGKIFAEGDFVIVHARITGFGPKTLIGVDIFKVKNQKIVEHWDVLQEEVPADQTASKNAMFPVR